MKSALDCQLIFFVGPSIHLRDEVAKNRQIHTSCQPVCLFISFTEFGNTMKTEILFKPVQTSPRFSSTRSRTCQLSAKGLGNMTRCAVGQMNKKRKRPSKLSPVSRCFVLFIFVFRLATRNRKAHGVFFLETDIPYRDTPRTFLFIHFNSK